MPPYHVLLADDDAMIRALVARVLVRMYAYVTVRAVANGLDALTIYDQEAIILDPRSCTRRSARIG